MEDKITYRGNRLVKGKSFIADSNLSGTYGDKLVYRGKIYGDLYMFESDTAEVILTESQTKLLKEHSTLQEQENQDDLYQLVSTYTDKQITLLEDSTGWKELKNSFQEELNKLKDAGLTYKVMTSKFEGDLDYLKEVILKYLKEVQRNVSETSLPNHYIQLTNFIYNIDKMGGTE